MEIFLFLSWGAYLIFLALIIFGWQRRSLHQKNNEDNSITVIVPFRNEAKNLKKIVQCLCEQLYKNYTVYFVNDHSEDNSLELLENLLSKSHLNARILELEGEEGKKMAIQKAIEASDSEIIVTTDSDCWMGPSWLVQINAAFTPQTEMVAGSIALEGGNSLFQRWQELEFSALVGTGGAMIKLGLPVMCNGANLAYRKSAFNRVNGFEGTGATPSGDDELLMYKIHKGFPGSVGFLGTEEALVKSPPANDLAEFVQQRKRWSSKWKVNKRPITIALALLIFFFHTGFITTVVLTLVGKFAFVNLALLLGIKVVLELIFVILIRQKAGGKRRLWLFVISQFFYPFYAICFGLIANFGDYKWKGRTYKV